jgi:DNA-binding transcriptional MerR regulator
MTPIVDLPNEPKYTIKTVATQIGVRPVTLRAWERRHDVLEPHRAENHYRLYSERDVAILRWLKHRVDEGFSIRSAVNELRAMTSNSVWPEVVPAAPVPAPFSHDGEGKSTKTYAALLAQAILHHDETQANAVLHSALAGYKLLKVCMEVLMPAVEEIDESWNLGKIRSEGRRFAINYLRSRLLSLWQAYPSRHNSPRIMIGCAPMEVRELESLMMAVILHSEGYNVEFLGPDINLEDLVDYAGYEQPSMVILWANTEFTALGMRHMQERLHSIRSKPIFGYAGQVFQEKQELSRRIPGVYLGRNFDYALKQTRSLLHVG